MNCYPAHVVPKVHESWNLLAKAWGYNDWEHFRYMVKRGYYAMLDINTGQTVFVYRG